MRRYSGHQRWPEAREGLPGKLLLEQRFEIRDGMNSEYLGGERTAGVNTDASVTCSRNREDSSMEGGRKVDETSKVMGRGWGVA